MEMEEMIPSAAAEFNFDSACTSPYISAPASPARFGTPFFSAPTSPNRAAAVYNAFKNFDNGSSTTNNGGFLSSVPFNWEDQPGIPKDTDQPIYTDHHDECDDNDDDDNEDFVFDFSGQLETCSLPADELFDGGKIKPLKPPPCLQYENKPADHSPKSPRSPKKMFKEAFTPRCRKKQVDPFAAAINSTQQSTDDGHHQRGRERNYKSSNASSSIRHKGTRSLSPLRVSDLLLDRENDHHKPKKTSSISSNSSVSSFFPSSWYRRWKIKDFFLFRSASEGRAASTAQLKNYAVIKKSNNNHQEDDVKNASFRSTDSVGSVSSSRRRSGPISAHELHYKINRALSEEMKRKTFLPYKQGLLGCLGFNPSVNEISRRFGSMSRG